jgi:hypothetical protein
MNEQIYEMVMDQSRRIGTLLGAIGAILKYNDSDLADFEFTLLAKAYVEVSTDQLDIDRVKEVAKQRGINLDS